MDASWDASFCCCPVLEGILREICSAGAARRLINRGGRFMNQLIPITADRAAALIAAVGERASYRFLEFFTAKSATRTPAAPTRAPRRNSSIGLRRAASRQSRRSRACMSPPMSSSFRRRDPRRPRSSAWRVAASVRLAGGGRDHAGQSRRRRARAAPCRAARQDAGA